MLQTKRCAAGWEKNQLTVKSHLANFIPCYCFLFEILAKKKKNVSLTRARSGSPFSQPRDNLIILIPLPGSVSSLCLSFPKIFDNEGFLMGRGVSLGDLFIFLLLL